ncbi:MAG: ribbon-helix-helix protein, CopG family [Nocardioidaceae bacterium]
MSSKPTKGTTHVLLPDGPVDACYDDTQTTAKVDDTLADELLDAARRYQDEHPELAPGRPSLSAHGTHSPHVSFRVPAGLAEQLDEQSAAEGVTRSTLARRALAAYLAATRRTA